MLINSSFPVHSVLSVRQSSWGKSIMLTKLEFQHGRGREGAGISHAAFILALHTLQHLDFVTLIIVLLFKEIWEEAHYFITVKGSVPCFFSTTAQLELWPLLHLLGARLLTYMNKGKHQKRNWGIHCVVRMLSEKIKIDTLCLILEPGFFHICGTSLSFF